MGKGNYNCECPFYECQDVVCIGHKPMNKKGFVYCPKQIADKCKADIAYSKEDELVIKETWEKLKAL